MNLDPELEWLETDGLGGYASGTAGLLRTRRYHALLVAAATPPTGRFVLVNGVEAFAATPAGTFPLSAQSYAPGVIHPEGHRLLTRFDADPWPRWRFALPDGTAIEQALTVAHGRPIVLMTWRLLQPRAGVTLTVRPLLSGRHHHALHHENPAFRFDEQWHDGRLTWRPYPGVPVIEALANGPFTREPAWYRSFLYKEERARGLDHLEDLASPGRFAFDLSKGEACLVLAAGERSGPRPRGHHTLPPGTAAAVARALRARETRRRERFPSRLHRAADAYLVRRGDGGSVIAGYPWFADWGRDTCIALRGLCLATGRLDEARATLLEWAGAASRGMLPNRFPDRGGPPEFNSVDAGLWFVIAAGEWRRAMRTAQRRPARGDETTLRRASEAILAGCANGTRHHIRAAGDGLLAAGEPGLALTWMDARVGTRPITPRIGKPVEVQALWINALSIGAEWSGRWSDMRDRALTSFRERFWYAAGGWLHDVVDDGHRSGACDPAFRPNQIFAVGGLPLPLIEGERARAVVDRVEARLLTPLGLRTLDPHDPAYRGRCEGGPAERDAAYHQGTVWPWLLGPFVEAWVRVRGGAPEVKREARRRFLEPLIHHLESAGIDHISEIADGDQPHAPRGCPFQAWSVGEALRLSLVTLAETRPAPRPARLRRLVKAARAAPAAASRKRPG